MSLSQFQGKLALQQRVMTAYRAPLFDALAQACTGGLSVCAGLPRPEESIAVTDQLQTAEFVAVQNSHLLKGPFYLCYQRGLPAWLEHCSPDALIVEANPVLPGHACSRPLDETARQAGDRLGAGGASPFRCFIWFSASTQAGFPAPVRRADHLQHARRGRSTPGWASRPIKSL